MVCLFNRKISLFEQWFEIWLREEEESLTHVWMCYVTSLLSFRVFCWWIEMKPASFRYFCFVLFFFARKEVRPSVLTIFFHFRFVCHQWFSPFKPNIVCTKKKNGLWLKIRTTHHGVIDDKNIVYLKTKLLSVQFFVLNEKTTNCIEWTKSKILIWIWWIRIRETQCSVWMTNVNENRA